MSWEMEKVAALTPFMKFLFRCAQESGPLSPEAEKDYIPLPRGFPAPSSSGGISLFSEDGWTVTDRSPLSNICHPFPFVLPCTVYPPDGCACRW